MTTSLLDPLALRVPESVAELANQVAVPLIVIVPRPGPEPALTVMVVSSASAVVLSRAVPLAFVMTAPAAIRRVSVPAPPGVTCTAKTDGFEVLATALTVTAGVPPLSKSDTSTEEESITWLKVTKYVNDWVAKTGPPAWLSTMETRVGSGSGVTVMVVSSGRAEVVTRGLPTRSVMAAPETISRVRLPAPVGVADTV